MWSNPDPYSRCVPCLLEDDREGTRLQLLRLVLQQLVRVAAAMVLEELDTEAQVGGGAQTVVGRLPYAVGDAELGTLRVRRGLEPIPRTAIDGALLPPHEQRLLQAASGAQRGTIVHRVQMVVSKGPVIAVAMLAIKGVKFTHKKTICDLHAAQRSPTTHTHSRSQFGFPDSGGLHTQYSPTPRLTAH